MLLSLKQYCIDAFIKYTLIGCKKRTWENKDTAESYEELGRETEISLDQ